MGTAVVLAAGAASRFGGGKLLATIGGRPVLQHVLDALADAGVGEVVVVLGDDAEAIERRSPGAPSAVSSTPIRAAACRARCSVGFEAVPAGRRCRPRRARRPAARLRRGHPAPCSTAPADPDRPVVVPVYADDARPQPGPAPPPGLRAGRGGDRAIADSGPSSRRTRSSSLRSRWTGANPDVDTREDLAAAIEASWASARPRQPRPGRADPRGPRRRRLLRPGRARSSGPTRPGRTTRSCTRCSSWSARATRGSTSGPARAGSLCRSRGRSTRRAARSSPSTRRRRCSRGCSRSPRTTRSRMCAPSRPAGRRRPGGRPRRYEADVVLIAHVGYDIEAIGPFIDAMESAAGRRASPS